jgi:hypothetical protein
LRDAFLRRTGFPLAGKTLPSPRPSKANIRLKFEGCFKGRDESNLNAAPARRLPISIRRRKAVNIAIFVDTSAIGNRRSWGHANHATRAVSAPAESERAPAFEAASPFRMKSDVRLLWNPPGYASSLATSARSKGLLAVEMEAAALYTFARSARVAILLPRTCHQHHGPNGSESRER